MKRLCIAIAALFLVGCAMATADKNFATINSSVAEFQTYLSTAESAIAAVLPDVSPADQVQLHSALASIKSANQLAHPISQANDKWKTDYGKLQSDDQMVRGSFGWRAEVAIKTSIVIAIIVGILLVVVFPALTPMLLNVGGLVTTITEHLHAALPLQNIAPLISSIGSKTAANATASTTANTTAKTLIVNSGTVPQSNPMVLNSAADAHGI